MNIKRIDPLTIVQLVPFAFTQVKSTLNADDFVDYICFKATLKDGKAYLATIPQSLVEQQLVAENLHVPENQLHYPGAILQFESWQDRDLFLNEAIFFNMDEFNPSSYMTWVYQTLSDLLYEHIFETKEGPETFWDQLKVQALLAYAFELDGDNDNVAGCLMNPADFARSTDTLVLRTEWRDADLGDEDYTEVASDLILDIRKWVSGETKCLILEVSSENDDCDMEEIAKCELDTADYPVSVEDIVRGYTQQVWFNQGTVEDLERWIQYALNNLDKVGDVSPGKEDFAQLCEAYMKEEQ